LAIHVAADIGGDTDGQLLAIRRGEWEYDRLIEYVEAAESRLNQVYRDRSYVVPKEPDRKAIQRLCVDLTSRALDLVGVAQ
jgi:hypothetical protein